MCRIVVTVAKCGFCQLALLLMCGLGPSALAQESNTLTPPAFLTNLAQLRLHAEQKPLVLQPFRIVAEILDADSGRGVLVLRDASSVEFIQLDLHGRKLEPGATVCLEGTGYGVRPKGFGLAVVAGMVVDDDGTHGMTVESGSVFLHAGLNPVTLQWFNRRGDFGLAVEYEGPKLSRLPVPSSVLSRAHIEPASGLTNFAAGLNYRCYEGTWSYLPDFLKYRPVKTGVATNFDLNVRTRDESVGLEFEGFITIPHDGLYRFYLTSDDGSRLHVGESSLDIRWVNGGAVPPALNKVPTSAPETNSRPWVTLEGTVHFAGVRGAGGEATLRVGNDDIRVEIFEANESVPSFPVGGKVRVSGIYQELATEDGPGVPGMLLVSSWEAIQPASSLEKGSATASSPQEARNPWTVEASPVAATLKTAAEIKALPSELAGQRIPVSIRGVVTAVLPAFLQGAVVQDSTKGVFVSLADTKLPTPLQRGEFYQIDGVTGPGLFAPVIIARQIKHLGAGQLPVPVHATREQLMNGSLDTQYAEIEGMVMAVHDQQIAMLTEGGEIALNLDDFQSEELASYAHALVRIRGCAFAFFNQKTHELDANFLRVMGGAVDVLQAAPRDLFDAPQKSLGELRLYDPKAAPFRRLKVSGQIIYRQDGEYFLTDGTNGLRVTTKGSDIFPLGDRVEAVGFLELGGPAAELKEAVLRKTGYAPLPPPTRLAPDHLLLASNAGTLVQMEARLVNYWRDDFEYVLELQSRLLVLRARMHNHRQSLSLPPLGSRLELTGVYSPQGSRTDGTASGFEVLLNSPTAIRVLAKPSWWTLKRVLGLAGIMAVFLCAVLIWNKELHRQVQERSRQLETEIQNRQRAELQQAAEAERARIARDLHDELGTGLTEVSLLASTGLGRLQEAEKSQDRFRVIAEKARALVSGLDVIVWAIDPRRNSLQSFADYLGRYAREFFSASDIVCRFKIPIECDSVTLSESARHSLFLAVKEALNNVIRHASATEMELQISELEDRLEVVIADNGRGFDWNRLHRGNGLTNFHERLEALNGQCHIETQLGKGTTVKFIIPVPRNSSNSQTNLAT